MLKYQMTVLSASRFASKCRLQKELPLPPIVALACCSHRLITVSNQIVRYYKVILLLQAVLFWEVYYSSKYMLVLSSQAASEEK